jgi:hydroxyacylglutathione hydrolase
VSRSPISLIPSLVDNYTPILVDAATRGALIVDPSESEPVLQFLADEHLAAHYILLTHHHGDHIGGVGAITERFPRCEVMGFLDDQHRLPPLTRSLRDGDLMSVFGLGFEVWHMPGHTVGHIIYVSRDLRLAFVGDVLFGAGCGRVFEGTDDDMFQTLQRFKDLPGDFAIYCAHEYTAKNIAFARERLPGNIHIERRVQTVSTRRASGLATVPLTLSEERLTNPFLLARDAAEFAELREARNRF